MCNNYSRKKNSGRRSDFIAGWYHTNKWCWIKRHIVLADVKNHLLHIDGDMSLYLIDKEHKSCLRTKHPILKQSKTNGESVMVLFLSQQ
jgi:hypothetical protein